MHKKEISKYSYSGDKKKIRCEFAISIDLSDLGLII